MKTHFFFKMLKLICVVAICLLAVSAEKISIKNLANYKIDTLTQAPTCPGPNEFINCEEYSKRYRTYDGSCNNLLYPWWGAVQTPYNRLLKPAPTCNGTAPRTDSEIDLNGLPTVIDAADLLDHDESYQLSDYLQSFYPFFSVFVAHDLFSTVPEYVDCECGSVDPECYNIRLLKHFQTAYEYDRECINYVRNMDSRKAFDCMFDHREQFSNTSHWLDLINLYGSNYQQAANFRVYKDGLLRFDILDSYNDIEILPIADINECLEEGAKTSGCFYGPDNRAFQTPSVTAIYTLWLYEHNRIATELKEQNSYWSDETLFQEARRITIAAYQHFIYNEFLPLIIGNDLVKTFNLKPLGRGYGKYYNNYLYANIYNEFATAAFPLINYLPNIVIEDGYNDVILSETWWRQDLTYSKFHELIVALAENNAQIGGFGVAESICNKYLEYSTAKRSNLPALMLQQGRDNAIQSYIEYRALAGLGTATGWTSLSNIGYSILGSLETVYTNVDEIDLLLGMWAEDIIDSALVGKTQGFIIAKQFSLLKFGDRHFYENGEDYANRFTEDQLNSIRGYSLRKWFCINGNVEYLASLYCSTYDDMDFSLWKETKSGYTY